MNETQEIRARIEVLYKNHYIWLLQSAKNITKNKLEAEDLIGDLIIYLLEKGTPKIYYKDSFNLMYCYRFLQTRWVNKIVKNNKLKINDSLPEYEFEILDEIYSVEEDERIMQAFDSVQSELERLSKTRDWPKAKLFQMYYDSDDTMLEVANKIGICKSTMFINIKRIREHLKETCPNPFKEQINE